jgi:hypothetical protein
MDPELPPEDAFVVRFNPVQPEAVLRKVRLEARRAGHHGASVFADSAKDGETEDDVIDRLLGAAELSHISDVRRYHLCAPAAELRARGFKFIKDQYDGELDEHYCVVLGDDPNEDDVALFLDAFEPRRREVASAP